MVPIAIAPFKFLDVIVEQPAFLLLSHLMLNEEYLAWVQRLKGYKIFDNSAFELREPDLSGLKSINVDEVVIPDYFFDSEKCKRAVDKYASQFKSFGLKTMAVVHGRYESELKDLIQYYCACEGVDVIGLPRSLGCEINGRPIEEHVMWSPLDCRVNLLKFLTTLSNVKPVHILGLGQSWERELQTYKTFEFVRSCDSSTPFRLAVNAGALNFEMKRNPLIEKRVYMNLLLFYAVSSTRVRIVCPKCSFPFYEGVWKLSILPFVFSTRACPDCRQEVAPLIEMNYFSTAWSAKLKWDFQSRSLTNEEVRF